MESESAYPGLSATLHAFKLLNSQSPSEHDQPSTVSLPTKLSTSTCSFLSICAGTDPQVWTGLPPGSESDEYSSIWWSNPNPNPRYDSNPNPNNSWSSLGPSRGLSPEHYPYNQQYHQHHSPHPTYPFPFPNPNSNSNLNSQLGRHPQAPGQSHSAPSDVGHGQQS
ncbi:hypothetical protein L218DRAFT_331284 [Marasmius fiardii PR-910]|nr:hypothetical protein L218DRAFT_331284 [Marasmius fiardii PR-910]